MRGFSFFLCGILVSWLCVLSFCLADEGNVVEVQGLGECADCKDYNFEASQAFAGLYVTIDCKLKGGEFKTRGSTKLDAQGKFKASISKDVLKNGKLNEECYAHLHSASATPCPAHKDLEESYKIVVSGVGSDRKPTFSPAENIKFSSALCTSAFLWKYFKHPPFPKFPLPPYHPIYKKPLPPYVPIYKPPFYKKPLPPYVPIYKPPFYKKPLPPYVPIYKPPVYKKPLPPYVPIYKPPVYTKPLPPPVPTYEPPVYTKPLPPPVPTYKPPVYHKPLPPPVPTYEPPVYTKPLPPPVPTYKPPVYHKPLPPPVPTYEPPVYTKPLPPPVPTYKPPVYEKPLPPPYSPEYKPPVYTKPPFPYFKKPCPPLPPLFNFPTIPNLPPKFDYFHKGGIFPPLPPYGIPQP